MVDEFIPPGYGQVVFKFNPVSGEYLDRVPNRDLTVYDWHFLTDEQKANVKGCKLFEAVGDADEELQKLRDAEDARANPAPELSFTPESESTNSPQTNVPTEVESSALTPTSPPADPSVPLPPGAPPSEGQTHAEWEGMMPETVQNGPDHDERIV